MRLSEHQRAGHCMYCSDDASKHNHCSWCGATLQTQQALANHMDDGCFEEIRAAMAQAVVEEAHQMMDQQHCRTCGEKLEYCNCDFCD